MRKTGFFQKYGILLVLIALIVFFSVASPAFFTLSNLMNVARQVSMIGITAVGMMFVMLTGGIDLSVGSMLSFVNVLCAYFMVNRGMHPLVASVFCIVIAAGFGYSDGIIITKLKIPPLIATLAYMNILSGIAFIISGSKPISGMSESFKIVGQGYIGPVPVPVIIMVVFIAIGAFILSKTYFGRFFYAIGGNEEASVLSGINVEKTKQLVYTLSAVFAAFSGIIMLSRLGSGQATTGNGFEFQVITAVVLGGVSVAGGSGKISGVVIGVLIMGILSNGLILLNIGEFVQKVIQGLVLIAAVGFDNVSKSRNMAKRKETPKTGMAVGQG